MNQFDSKEDIGMSDIRVTKREDGMFEASCKSSGLPPVTGETIPVAMNRMTRAIDDALKTNKLRGL